MSEMQPERLQEVVSRLMQAHQEALEAVNQTLWPVETFEDAGLDSEDDAQLLERSEHLEAALEDVRAILEGALDDVRYALEGDTGA